jgi:hypothetical protein
VRSWLTGKGGVSQYLCKNEYKFISHVATLYIYLYYYERVDFTSSFSSMAPSLVVVFDVTLASRAYATESTNEE